MGVRSVAGLMAAVTIASSVMIAPTQAQTALTFTALGSVISTQAGGTLRNVGLPRRVVVQGLGTSDRVLIGSSFLDVFSFPIANWSPVRLAGLEGDAGDKGIWVNNSLGGPSNGVVGYVAAKDGFRYSVVEVFGGGQVLRSWWLPNAQCANLTDASLSLQRVIVVDGCNGRIRLFLYGGVGGAQTSSFEFNAPNAAGQRLSDVTSIDVSKDGSQLVLVGSNLVRVFNIANGNLVRELAIADPARTISGAAFDAAGNIWTIESATAPFPGGRLRGFDSAGAQFTDFALPVDAGFNQPLGIDVSFSSGRFYISNQRNNDFAHGVIALAPSNAAQVGAGQENAVIDNDAASLNGGDASAVNPNNPSGQEQADAAAAPRLKAKFRTFFRYSKGRIVVKARCPVERCTLQASGAVTGPKFPDPGDGGEVTTALRSSPEKTKKRNSWATLRVRVPAAVQDAYRDVDSDDTAFIVVVTATNRAGGTASASRQVFPKVSR